MSQDFQGAEAEGIAAVMSSLPFCFFSFVYTVLNCFLLNNNPPVIQHSQKNQTAMDEKGRPDTSVGFSMSMAVNQWCFPKMSC